MRYHAFISYSHAADGKLAPALERALKQIAKPIFKIRALNVFRDETDLSATPHLWGAIEEALSKSQYFILLASPIAAKSPWVQKEVNYWLNEKSVDTLLIGLTDGKIIWNDTSNDFDWNQTNGIPFSLKNKYQGEPLYSDFRKAKSSEDLSLNNPDFKMEAAKLAAEIHGKTPDDLIGEDVRLQKRAVRLKNLAILVLSFLLLLSSLTTWWAWNRNTYAQNRQKYAEEQQRIALDSAESAQIQRQVAEKNLADRIEQEKQKELLNFNKFINDGDVFANSHDYKIALRYYLQADSILMRYMGDPKFAGKKKVLLPKIKYVTDKINSRR